MRRRAARGTLLRLRPGFWSGLRSGIRSGVWLGAAFAAVLTASSGCVAYRSGALPKGGGLSTQAGSSGKTVSVLVRVEYAVNGMARPLPDYLRDAWTAATFDAYRESGLFSQVRR